MLKRDQECSTADCSRIVGAKGARGLCSRCYQASKREAFRRSPSGECALDGCGRFPAGPGAKWCRMHYARWRRLGDTGSAEGWNRPRGSGGFGSHGYILIQRNGRRISEHRWVVEESLGRELHPFENVHHKNGVRHDNRLENLEIWVIPQPKGQRAEDLLAWCREHERELLEAAEWNVA